VVSSGRLQFLISHFLSGGVILYCNFKYLFLVYQSVAYIWGGEGALISPIIFSLSDCINDERVVIIGNLLETLYGARKGEIIRDLNFIKRNQFYNT